VNCQGCGVEIDPSLGQVNTAVDEILKTSLADAEKKGGVCPLCGHCKDIPVSHRKTVLFGLLLASLLISAAVATSVYRHRQTQRNTAALDAISRMEASPEVIKLLGKPISLAHDIPGHELQGEVKQDETGWKEVKLTIPVRGPKGEGVAQVIGGKSGGPWVYTTFEVVFEKEHKKLDLITGRAVEYDPAGYHEVHFEAATAPELTNANAAAPRWDGEFPCVFATAAIDAVPQLGKCAMPTMQSGPVDRFEVDLRYGSFTLRQTDLYLNDVFQVPLTRSYASNDWISQNNQHAFGWNTNHPYDIAPLGTRNPYTFQLIALEDSNFVYFDRISKGTGYADSVFQHTETSSRFYKATTRWNGTGWTTRLTDGSEIHFPESYNGRNLAQGAPFEMLDAKGNRLELKRDAKRDLQQIVTPHGRWIKFQYDEQSRITRADDDAGNWVTYSYSPDGVLTDVTLSSGHQRHYSYEKRAMTQVADETGKVLLRNWYDRGVLVRQDFANGELASYHYQWTQGARCPEKATVKLGGGSEQEVSVAGAIPEYVRGFDHH
jgi:YD repeat-containing protein